MDPHPTRGGSFQRLPLRHLGVLRLAGGEAEPGLRVVSAPDGGDGGRTVTGAFPPPFDLSGMRLPEPSPTGRYPAGPGWDHPKGSTWLTAAEAAYVIGTDYDGLRQLAREGELPAHRVGGLM